MGKWDIKPDADALPVLGTVPPGFVSRRSGSAVVTIRQSWQEPLLSSGILTDDAGPPPSGEMALSGGRGSASIHTITGIGPVVLRRYRRGGLIGKILFDRYLFGSRPTRELAVLAYACARGVPVPEAVGASVVRTGLLWHRGRIATRMIPDSVTLPVFIGKNRDDARVMVDVLGKAGAAIRLMHDAGINHADLNMNNILVDAKQSVFIIDFDKAAVHRVLCLRRRIGNLRRLLRSLRKLQAKGQRLEDNDFSMIIGGYAGDDPALLCAIEKKTLGSRLLALRSAVTGTRT